MLRRLALAGAFALATLSVLPAHSIAGTTGKLSGRVLDKKGQPLAGANVTVPSAHLGIATDDQGRYVIINIPAGAHEVKFGLLGYGPLLVRNVQISADQTTALDAALEEAPLEMKEVVVDAKRPVVDLALTSTLATISRNEIRQLPVQELQEIVNLQAGVVDGHFHGGRKGEVQYQVDGVTINNPFDNSAGIPLDRSLLEEVQVVSGTFDAEYGQAMSGVVNAVLRRGTDRLQWDAEVLLGDFYFSKGNRIVKDEVEPAGIQNFQVTVGGPLPVPKTFFFLSGRRYSFDDYVFARRIFRPPSVFDDSANVYILTPGDGGEEPLAYTRQWSGAAKLTNRSLPNIELNYQTIFDFNRARGMKWAYRYNPEGASKQRTFSIVHGLDATHTLSPRTVLQFAVRQNYREYRDMLYDDFYDPRYDAAATQIVVPGGPEEGAVIAGLEFARAIQTTNALVFKSTLTSQRTHDQQVKLGAEAQWPIVEFGDAGYLVSAGSAQLVRHDNEPPKYPGVKRFSPFLGGAFGQGELEWNDLKLRAGLRMEYFDPRAKLPSDLANPANSISGQPRSYLARAHRKVDVAPRIGVSYPVTKDAALYFAYGHFYQMAALGDIYKNADYSILSDLQAGAGFYGANNVVGNPDLRPERTVQYQFGYKQAVTEWLGIDASAAYKDIRDLLGVEFVTTYNNAEYARLTNSDFGSVIGFTLSVDQLPRGIVSTHLDYTWQVAEGNTSDPRETATRAQNNEDPRPRQVPFDWDQRHTFNLTLTLARPERFSVSTVVRVASGQPYSPASFIGHGFGQEANSGRKPTCALVDLRGEKPLRLGGLDLQAFGRIFNVFDTRFFNGFVFSTSGSPYYSRFPNADNVELRRPTRYYGPRRVEIGVTLRPLPLGGTS